MQCTKHPFDRATDVCAHCGLVFCRPCLVYPNGERNAPYCVTCAVVRAGLRVRGPVIKPIGARQWKRRRRELHDHIRTHPTTGLNMAMLADLPFVGDDEILERTGARHDRPIDWCA